VNKADYISLSSSFLGEYTPLAVSWIISATPPERIGICFQPLVEFSTFGFIYHKEEPVSIYIGLTD
jgi:hypothetical protein